MNYEDVYPKEWGPPPIKPGEARRVLASLTPKYDVVMDIGALQVVWELVEAEAKRKWPTHETLHGVQALLRGVEALRTAFFSGDDQFIVKVDLEAPAARKVASNGTVPKKRSFSGSPGSTPPTKKRSFSATTTTVAPTKRRSFSK
jgi:hypothetical protein